MNNNIFGFNQNKDDYFLARLIIAKKYIQSDQKQEAIDCLDDMIHDMVTDYDSEVRS